MTRNKTITLTDSDLTFYTHQLLKIDGKVAYTDIENRIINQNLFDVLNNLPESFADVLFLDSPYNLNKSFNSTRFAERSETDYARWFASWFPVLLKTLKSDGSIYVCADWKTSISIAQVLDKHVIVQNRITWEREKGRGALRNWKNCSEDIWFCTLSDDYTFNIESVKLKRRVMAPYTLSNGRPKDWQITNQGNYRLTYPSNIWTDLTVPFWSMSENTEHPTQKPEKLLAKIILASSNPGDLIFDPFVGSGTSAVVAKKLGRRFTGIEIDTMYCCLTQKRLDMSDQSSVIQGYSDGIFWERNSLSERVQKPSVQQSEFLC